MRKKIKIICLAAFIALAVIWIFSPATKLALYFINQKMQNFGWNLAADSINLTPALDVQIDNVSINNTVANENIFAETMQIVNTEMFSQHIVSAGNILIKQKFGNLKASEFTAKLKKNSASKIYLKNFVVREQDLSSISGISALFPGLTPELKLEELIVNYIFDQSNKKIKIVSMSSKGDCEITGEGDLNIGNYYKFQGIILFSSDFISSNSKTLSRISKIRNINFDQPVSIRVDSPSPIDINKIYLKNL